jgi:hypothetical protein
MTHNSTNGTDQGMDIAPDDAPTPRTLEEIETLKASWLSDGCWDIEETEGFEYHYQELRQWREAHNAEWDRKEREQMKELTEQEIDALIKSAGLWDVMYDGYRALSALLRAYGAQERERCAKVMCRRCREGIRLEGDKHFVNDGMQARGEAGRWVLCAAHSIRALPND